jgi:DNA-binding GntR family transcriptional regulator
MPSTRPNDRAEQSLNEISYRTIKREIVRCTLAPASSVSESSLCERLGLGRAAVRYSLAKLAQEGLVQSVPKRGYIVSPVTLKDVEDIYTMRLLLEPGAARLAALRITPDEVRAITAIDSGDLPGGPDYLERSLQQNMRFHLAVANASGNPRIATAVARLLEEVERMLHLWIGSGESIASEIGQQDADHERVVKCLASRDAAGAEAALRDHLVAAHQSILKTVVKRPSLVDLGAR